MLSARRKSDGQIVAAYFEHKRNGPFACLECSEEVLLKVGERTINHFAHANPLACRFASGESESHRRCKKEIFEALCRESSVRDAALERAFGTNRADIFACINGVPVAIEVQISHLSLETIQRRTITYARQGIHVLWLLPWNPKIEAKRYSPTLWEKWIHAAYFGRVYYWLEGLSVASYSFEPSLKAVPRKTWYLARGKKVTGGGYSRRLKRYRTAVRETVLNLVRDFGPKERDWWQGEGGLTVPWAKLFMHRSE